MRTIILGLLMPIFGVFALTSPINGILTLNFITFVRPHTFTWSFWHYQPVFKIFLGLAILSVLLRMRVRFRMPAFVALFLLFFIWLTLSNYFAYNKPVSWAYWKQMMVSFPIVMLFLSSSILTLKELRNVLIVMAGGVGLVAAKTGFMLSLSGGGHITTNTSGFVGDNNVLGLSICLIFGVLMGMRVLIKNKKKKWIFWFFIAMVLLTILYTKSRGAFLTIAIIFFITAMGSKNPFRNSATLAVLAVMGFLILPNDLFDRLATLSSLESDSSAMGRLAMWKYAVKQAELFPWFGVGLNGFRYFNVTYWAIQFDSLGLVTHSIYFQVLSAGGYPALLLYLSMVFITLWNLHRTYRESLGWEQQYPDLKWVRFTSFWMRNGFLGYCVGAGFLDMLPYDVPWYFMLYANLLRPVFTEELRNREYEREMGERQKREEALQHVNGRESMSTELVYQSTHLP